MTTTISKKKPDKIPTRLHQVHTNLVTIPKLTIIEFTTVPKKESSTRRMSKLSMIKTGGTHYYDVDNKVTYRLSKGWDSLLLPQEVNSEVFPSLTIFGYKKLNATLTIER